MLNVLKHISTAQPVPRMASGGFASPKSFFPKNWKEGDRIEPDIYDHLRSLKLKALADKLDKEVMITIPKPNEQS
jgi:hypothetical protein